MEIYDKKGLERSTVISFLMFLFLIFLPSIAAAIDPTSAETLSKMSESNPYMSLIFAMGTFCVTCIGACGYVYNQSLAQGKDLMQIQKEQIIANLQLADKIGAQTIAIEKNQEIIEKSLDTTNARLDGRPCLFDLDDLKKRK
jgi:hypothetical protein